MRRRRATGWLLAGALTGGLLTAGPAGAATFNVTTTADGTGACTVLVCTVRSALQAAQDNGNGAPDAINIPAGDYELTSGSLLVGTTKIGISIVGAGADKTTIRGNGQDRLLRIGGESSLTIQKLTFTGGTTLDAAGGGNLMVNSGALALSHVRVTGGSALRGGGIAVSSSTLLITHSLIDGNQTVTGGDGDGGGIAAYNGSSTLVTDSTVTSNTGQFGGGIAVSDAPSDSTGLTRVTLAGNTSTNSSGGGILVDSGSRAPDIAGSIVAANLGKPGRLSPIGPSNCSGTAPIDGGGNVETATDCAFVRVDSRQSANPGLATTLVSDGGTTPVLPIAATSPARELAGACTGSDQRDVIRPQGALCDAGAYEYVEPPPSIPIPQVTATPAPTAVPTPAPAPTFHETIVAGRVSGTILIRRPGSTKFEALGVAAAIPLGSTVDARRGVVVITSVPKAGGTPESAKFWDGLFKVTQPGSITQLALTEPLAPCRKKASAAATKAKKRKLWGDGKGKFRTKGQYSAATVRGTKWLTEDTCVGTLTRVTSGVVSVRDNVRHKSILVRAGRRYTAKPR